MWRERKPNKISIRTKSGAYLVISDLLYWAYDGVTIVVINGATLSHIVIPIECCSSAVANMGGRVIRLV